MDRVTAIREAVAAHRATNSHGIPMGEQQLRRYYPDATDGDVARMMRMESGEPWGFNAPQVCTAKWGLLEWSRVAIFSNET